MAAPATLETLVGWVTIREAIGLWADAPGEEEDGYLDLTILLSAAHDDLLRYAPRAVFAPGAAPAGAKLAQVLLTQHLAARKRSGDGENYGAEGFQMSTYPLVLEARDQVKRWRGIFRGLR